MRRPYRRSMFTLAVAILASAAFLALRPAQHTEPVPSVDEILRRAEREQQANPRAAVMVVEESVVGADVSLEGAARCVNSRRVLVVRLDAAQTTKTPRAYCVDPAQLELLPTP